MSREAATDLSMLERLAAPAGRDVVDIGCGGGGLARELARRGARVVGVEVSAEQLAGARAHEAREPHDAHGTHDAHERPETAAPYPPPTYRIGTAQALPLEDESVDLAVFMRTLHHVPPAELPRALSEARRVLRPGGLVYVAEPLAEGDFYALSSLVEDELEVRRAAAAAIARAGAAGLEREVSLEYEVRFCLADVSAFRARNISADPDRAELWEAREHDITAAFARLGEPGERPGERCFVQPMRADRLRRRED